MVCWWWLFGSFMVGQCDEYSALWASIQRPPTPTSSTLFCIAGEAWHFPGSMVQRQGFPMKSRKKQLYQATETICWCLGGEPCPVGRQLGVLVAAALGFGVPFPDPPVLGLESSLPQFHAPPDLMRVGCLTLTFPVPRSHCVLTCTKSGLEMLFTGLTSKSPWVPQFW
jgi:hypothetical protein